MHSLLEDYLAEVAARLGPLPAKRRAEELREMRAHLEAAYAAGLAQGQSDDETARDVLAQFGAPEAVGAETVAVWRRGVRLDRRDFWGAAACALVLMFLLPRLMEPLQTAYFHRYVVGPLLFTAFFVFFGGVIYLLAGAAASLLFPRRTVAGIGLAWSIHLFWIFHVGFRARHAGYGVILTQYLYFLVYALIYGLFCLLGVWLVSRWRTARTGRARVARG